MDEMTIAWIAGTIMSLIGWGSIFHFAWIMRNWPQAVGRIVGNSAEWSKSGSTGPISRKAVYFPEIEFDAGGTLHRAKGGVGQSKPHEMGAPVILHYKPDNPDHLLDLNFWQRMFFSGGFIVIGGLCLAAAAGWIS